MAYVPHWTLEDIPWAEIDRTKIDDDVLKVIKTAALVEYNARTYTDYLIKVFDDDPEFRDLALEWAEEEVRHGKALGKWAELADPGFSLERAFGRFTAGFKVPDPVAGKKSIRGSRSGELVARCMVETGTSSYYTAIADAVEEPVLKKICRHIAADELRHYKLFYVHLKRYLERERVSRWRRVWIGIGRVVETEDDELAYAYYAANAGAEQVYERRTWNRAYARRAYAFYRPHHLNRAAAMIFKACGLKTHTRLFNAAAALLRWVFHTRAQRLATAGA